METGGPRFAAHPGPQFDRRFQKLTGRGETYYLNGDPHGKMTLWRNDGSKWLEMTFVAGKPHGIATALHPNGHKQWDMLWVDGERQGPFLSVWPNGNIEIRGTFKDDGREGDWNEWDDTGHKTYEGRYVNGEPDGLHRRW